MVGIRKENPNNMCYPTQSLLISINSRMEESFDELVQFSEI
jgi:hypothetical protein